MRNIRGSLVVLLCFLPALLLLGVQVLAETGVRVPNGAAEATVPAYLPMVVLPPTPTATVPAGALPDLIIRGMSIGVEHTQCLEPGANLGISVLVENVGLAPAGGFAVLINGGLQTVVDGLGSGEYVSLWSPGYNANGENVAIADAGKQVAESNENNNRYAARLPIPTPPIACTPVPK